MIVMPFMVKTLKNNRKFLEHILKKSTRQDIIKLKKSTYKIKPVSQEGMAEPFANFNPISKNDLPHFRKPCNKFYLHTLNNDDSIKYFCGYPGDCEYQLGTKSKLMKPKCKEYDPSITN